METNWARRRIFPLTLSLLDRYWGESSPYTELNAETLQYLNVENAMADLMYFANTVDLPFDTDFSSNAQNAV